jgi:hypothetical protein
MINGGEWRQRYPILLGLRALSLAISTKGRSHRPIFSVDATALIGAEGRWAIEQRAVPFFESRMNNVPITLV